MNESKRKVKLSAKVLYLRTSHTIHVLVSRACNDANLTQRQWLDRAVRNQLRRDGFSHQLINDPETSTSIENSNEVPVANDDGNSIERKAETSSHSFRGIGYSNTPDQIVPHSERS